MPVLGFIIAIVLLLVTGASVLFLCICKGYKEAIQTFVLGVVIAVMVAGIPLFPTKANQKKEVNKMEDNYITIGFTEEEVDEIVAEYYGLDTEFQPDKEWLEDAKAELLEDDFKRIILEKIL